MNQQAIMSCEKGQIKKKNLYVVLGKRCSNITAGCSNREKIIVEEDVGGDGEIYIKGYNIADMQDEHILRFNVQRVLT